MAGHRFDYWVPIGLLVLCLALIWVIFQQLAAASNDEPVAADGSVIAAIVPDLPPEPHFEIAPIEAFEIVVQRPLFSPTRRPPIEQTARVTTSENVTLVLKGILIDKDARIALIRPRNSGKIERLAEGQEIGGWTVMLIAPDHVVLERGGREQTLEPGFD